MTKNSKLISEKKNLSVLQDLATGYQRSKTLFTLVELSIPTFLNKKDLSAKELAKKLRIDSLAMERFLNACVTLGLLKIDENNKFSNTEISENFLVKSAEFYLGGQIKRYDKRSYPIWEDLTNHLKSWKYGETTEVVPTEDDQGSEAMSEQHNLSLLHGTALAESFDFSKFNHLLDIGGGTGAMSIGLCRKFRGLHATVYDLPENTKIAKKFIKKDKLENKIKCVGADFKKDPLPDNFNIALLANFMSVADENENAKLLSQIYEKLPKGGVCMLSGLILDDSRLAPQSSVLFCLEDICRNSPDAERTEKVYRQWMLKAGFKKIKSKTYLASTKMLYGYK